ncbi:OLC1v1019358C1 [Oldenlandia corymbosa var. corymbosa]|uniref:OLC1v1019358C1 n=1 Tax=Oldenlandia corymbosa var. corymbosa TaxID=529605 RepID=A0AAV1EDS2_OLDCO|nr:OLC1v1019358C1 [Oldenlandia corymbosa var. corymbosa]
METEMELPPDFAGENPKEWLRKYNDFCSSLRIPDSEKKDWVEPFLRDGTKIWYENFKKLVSAQFSWDEFSENLIWSFGGKNESASNNHHAQTMDQMDVDHKVDVSDIPHHGNIVTCANDAHQKAGDVKIAPGSSNIIDRMTGQKRLVSNGCSSPLSIAWAQEALGMDAGESDVHLDLTFPITSTSPLNGIEGREKIDNDHESLTSKGKRVMHTALAHEAPDAQSAHPPHSPPTVNELAKRQKPWFTSSSSGECSRAALDSRDVILNCSSGNAERMHETRSRIAGTTLAAEVDGPSTQGSNSDNAAGAVALPIEADEILLEEQFHGEVPSVGVIETDAHYEMAVQQAYELSPRISRRRNGPNSRRSSIESSSRQPQSTTATVLSRRGFQHRAPTVNRMTRSRNRGLPAIFSIRQIDSLFSADMDIELRMDILEAIVDINDDSEEDDSFLQTQHDFNENEYDELLAALGENIHHGSSSVSRIDSLPQSIVQSDSFEEACVICFDTPVIGDTIRHLPCLHKFHKASMDQMDVDHIIDVPDTPDRITAQNVNGKSILDRRMNSSMSGFLENRSRPDGPAINFLKVKENGIRKFWESPSKSVIPSSVSDQNSLGHPSSSNNSSVTRRLVTADMPTHEYTRFQPTENNKKKPYSQSSLGSGPIVDTKEFDGRVGACKKALPFGVPDNRDERFRRKLPSVVRPSLSRSNVSSSMTSHSEDKGKEAGRSGSGSDYVNVVTSASNAHHKVADVKTAVAPSNTMHRVTGQKRLVRNGCISPLNIARAKESVGKEKVESDVQNIGGTERIDSGHESLPVKGKSVLGTPLTINEAEAQSTHLSCRKSLITEIVKDPSRSCEELGGWISTRNRSKLSFPSPSRKHYSDKWVDLSSGSPMTMAKKLDTGSASGISLNHPMNLHVPSLPSTMPEPGHLMGHQPAVNEKTKRQKQQFTSSNNGECSRSAFNSPEVVLIGSSGNVPRKYENRSRNPLDPVVPVIEIDESSPSAKVDGPSTQSSRGHDTGAMAMQIEADELLARELQEQFYNEVPSVGGNEMDATLAMALQQAYEPSASSSGRRNGSNARRSSVASSSRQPQIPSTAAATLARRGSQSRASTSNRMSRLRNRFPGQPRTLSSGRARDPVFPAGMDVETRMHILEALEAISDDMRVNSSLLQTQRDFNENDYEMLLALDENNHHRGASTSLINGLPQSTVQTANFEEACAICLDTPEMGDTIRHLPCLHKFHKDCIDPWLKRKTCCPVCKSSIT